MSILVSRPPEEDESYYDFYRCKECKRLITFWEERRALATGSRQSICPCQGKKYSPTWPVGLEWLNPRILWFLALRTLRLS